VDGRYEVITPPTPDAVLVEHKKRVQLRPLLKEAETSREDLDARLVGALVQGDFEWLNVPIIVTAPPSDPVYLQPGAPYRFEVVLSRFTGGRPSSIGAIPATGIDHVQITVADLNRT
jgi:hypothetical protein